jgi:hypothetical protein
VLLFFLPINVSLLFFLLFPFLLDVLFVTALSFLHIILFGTGKRNIIEKGTTSKVEGVNKKGKVAKTGNRWKKSGEVNVRREVGRKEKAINEEIVLKQK